MGKSEKEYFVYFGIPHCHTGFSTGKGSPFEAYYYAKKRELDFLVITDHMENLKRDDKWNKLCNDCKIAKEKIHKFLPLVGYEIRLQNNFHINLIEPSSLLFNRYYDYNSIVKCITDENSIIALNHPSGDAEGFILKNKVYKNIQLIEVGNGLFNGGKYKDYESVYYSILNKGIRLGVLNSQDNHGVNWGFYNNLTAVVSKSLKKEDFLEALRERRTYSTECRGVYIKFTLNEKWMGSSVKVNHGEELKFKIKVASQIHNINKLCLISNGGKEVSSLFLNNVREVQWKPLIKNFNPSYYILKVIFSDKSKAITSAIFVNY